MKKVVFKGVINGEEFDNVKDYNEKISDLLRLGETIKASSDTHIYDEDEQQVTEKKPEARKEFDLEDFIPFFNSNAKQHYLDELVTDDKDLNEKRLNDISNLFHGKYKNLHDDLRNRRLTVEQAVDLAQVVKDIRSTINNDQQSNKDRIDDLKREIERMSDQLVFLQYATPFIETTKHYYDSVWNDLKIYLLS